MYKKTPIYGCDSNMDNKRPVLSPDHDSYGLRSKISQTNQIGSQRMLLGDNQSVANHLFIHFIILLLHAALSASLHSLRQNRIRYQKPECRQTDRDRQKQIQRSNYIDVSI